jgi:hypothetical protein
LLASQMFGSAHEIVVEFQRRTHAFNVTHHASQFVMIDAIRRAVTCSEIARSSRNA